MLQHLHIQNYAIIEDLKIEFSSHLNIITGETGAGKSILMGALGLILGDRADCNILLDRERKCFVEGVFVTEHAAVKDFVRFHEYGDESNEILIRREISPNSKSRAFINDIPASITLLKQLSGLLVDLHQQFDTQELGDSDFQRQVIDALAGNTQPLIAYHTAYKKVVTINKELADLRQKQAGSSREQDYKKFLLDELIEADLKEDELELVQQELKLITNAENIKATLNKAYALLEEGELPLVQQLKSLTNQLNGIKDYHTDLPILLSRIQSVQIELQDISDDLDRINRTVNFDEEKINYYNERLSIGYRLLKKHDVLTTRELLVLKDSLTTELENVSNLSETINQKEKEATTLNNNAVSLAQKLSVARKNQVKPFQKKVDELLAKVGMPNAHLKIDISDRNELQPNGMDNIDFLFDANKSGRFESLKKVASGGELSRLMLSIKSLVAKSVQLPTLIFDEIDTGISGEAARQVGTIMKDLASAHQLIAITHQPQIAARAAAHFFIYKELNKDKIVTKLKLLNTEERVNAIATMLSGEKPTPAAFENAREMMAG